MLGYHLTIDNLYSFVLVPAMSNSISTLNSPKPVIFQNEEEMSVECLILLLTL